MIGFVTRRRRLLSTCLTGAVLGVAGTARAQSDSPAPTWQPHASLYAEAGSENNEAGVEFFAPLVQGENALVFATGRLGYDERFDENGSAILGLRGQVTEGLALGINAGIDAYQSEFGSRSQIAASLGVEAFTSMFDVRFNYHLPLSNEREIAFVDPTTTGAGALVIESNRLVERRLGFRLAEVPLRGFDGEAGFRLPLSDRLTARISGGGFRYADDEADENFEGVRGGFELELDSAGFGGMRFTIGAEVQDDNRFGTHGRGLLRVSIPFGGSSTRQRAPLTGIQRQMADRVRRDYAAPSGTRLTNLTADSFAIDARTGRAFGGVFFVDGGATGAGTAADPTTLNDGVTRAGQNGVVVALGSGGTITTTGITLATDQYLVGGAGSVDVRLTDGTVTAASFGGTNGIISGTNAAGATVTLGTGSVVRDVTIRGAGTGILASGVGGFQLNRVVIENTGGAGLSLTNATGAVLIDGLTVRGAAGPGVLINGGSAVTVRNSTLAGGAGALDINDNGAALTVSLSNLTLSATGGNVLDIDGSGSGTVTVTGLNGITIRGGNGETGGLAARSVTFDGDPALAGVQTLNAGRLEVGTTTGRVAGTGVSLTDVTGSLTFADLDIANSGGTGLLVQNSKTNSFTLASADGTIDTVGGTAMNLDPLLIDLVFASVSASGASGPGLVLSDVQGAGPNGRALQIGTLTITNSGQQGLLITGGSTGNIIIGGGTISGSGGAAVQVGEQGVAGSGGAVNLTFGAAITETGTGPAIALYLVGGALSFTGPITGSGGILVDGTLAGSNVTIAGPTLTGTAGPAISLDNVAGALTFTGTTTIANPTGDGIVIGSVPGGVTFGNVDITGLGAGTGLDLTATQGNVTIATLDITGTGAPGSIGIDLRGATNGGVVIIGAPSTIQNVDIGVDLTNAAMTGSFRFGDGNAGNGLQSLISANVPLVILALNPGTGTYNFADANLVGDISNLTGIGFTAYYVAAGANGAGSASDPGSLAGAEASGADYIVLLNDPTGGQDVIDAASAGGSLDLLDGQSLVSFLNGDFFAVSGGALPPNLIVSGIGPSGISNPFAGSGASILTTTAAGNATVNLADGATLDGVIIDNDANGVGVAGNGTTNVTLANSQISGATGAVLLSDAGGNASALLTDVTLSASAGTVLALDGTGAGSLTVSGSGIDITATGSARAIDADGVTAGGLAFGAIAVGTAAGTAIELNAVTGGPVTAASVTIGGTSAGDGISISNSAATITFGNVSIANTAGAGIALSGIAGTVSFAGTTTISAPGTAGIVLGAGTSGMIAFGNTDITGLTANTTGLDARNAGGTVTFATLDIGGASTAGTRGIDLTGASFDGSVTTTDSGTITGVGVGVDLTNAAITGTFQYGDGSNTDADGAASTINAGTPIVVTGMNGVQGTYNFADVNLVGDTSVLSTSETVYYVLAGANGAGTRDDPGSLVGAEASGADIIVLLNNPDAGVDTLDAIDAGGALSLAEGQDLLSFLNEDSFDLPGGAPGNVILFGIAEGLITNPFAGSGAPILTTTRRSGTATVILGGDNLIDGVVIHNDGNGVGILGSDLIGTTVIRDSHVAGVTGAISISDGNRSSALLLTGLTLSASGGPIVSLLGTGLGSLTVRALSNLTLLGGNGETGGIVVNDVTFDANGSAAGNQAVEGGLTRIGTAAARVSGAGLSLTDVDGAFGFIDIDIATSGGPALLVANDGANNFIFVTRGGTIDAANGTGVQLTSATLNVALDGITASGGAYGVFLSDTVGTFAVAGATTISNPGTAGIVFGVGSTGTIIFGDTDITGLGANTTGVDARNAAGNVTFATLDITGASATGTRGIDLTGASFPGNVITVDSGIISGVGIGVDLTNAGISGNFQYGDGSNTDADGAASTINATIPIVITGLNAAQGLYNFADVNLIGDTGGLETSLEVFYVLQGASGAGTRSDPGSLVGAEASSADVIVLLNNPAGGQDTLDAVSAAGSLNLDADQILLSFLNQDAFALAGGAPPNLILFGITSGVSNPFAGSGAPILTTTAGGGAATVVLTGNNLLDGVIIRNGGTGAGIFGSGLTGTITIRNSQVSGAASAIDISDGATDASLLFQNLTLSASNGNIVNLLGTGAGSLTVRMLSGLTLLGGNGETGGLVVNDATFDSDEIAGGDQTVDAGAITIGTNAARVGGNGLSLTNVNGALSFADLDVSNNAGDGVLLVNSGANTFTLTTLAGTIDTTTGSGVELNGGTLAMTLGSVTNTGGDAGVFMAGSSGSFAVTGTVSATNVGTGGLAMQDVDATVSIGTLNVSNPAAGGYGILVVQTSAGTLDLNVNAGNLSTSANGPISVANSGGGTVDLAVTLASASTTGPVATGLRFENTGAGALTGSVNITGGSITSTTDALLVNGGALTVTYGGTLTANAGNSVDVSNTSGDVTVSGTITDSGAGVLVNNLLSGGSVSLIGSSTFGGQGINATNIASGASISFNSVTANNTTGAAITLTDIDGSATFTGTTRITNPAVAGIVLGAGSTGTIAFGDTDIISLGANTTGVDARNASGTVTFATLDISGASTTGTRGIDLTGATFSGNVTTTDSGTITGVGIGVDLTNANISGIFQYGDGSNVDADGAASTINATTPLVITGLNGAQGTYNFADVNLIGDTSALSTSASVFYVLQGATGVGTRNDPGSLSGAEAATADYIVLLNDPAGGQDTLDATTGAAGSFDLDPGQTLLSFLNTDNFALPGGAPANVILFGITQGADNPFAGSGAPILTTTAGAAATVILSGNNLLDGLIVRNGGTGAGVFGAGLTGTITIRNSQVSGAASAIDISDGATSASLLFQNLTLSASGGNIVNLLGTGAGSLTVRMLSGLTLLGGNGETGGLVVNDATFDSDAIAGGNQTVDAGAITIGTNAARVGGNGLSLTNVNGGLSFADLDIASNNGAGVLLVNTGANTFTLGTAAGTIDALGGSGLQLNVATLAMTLDSVTAANGSNGVFLAGIGGSLAITGTLSATNVTTGGLSLQDMNATVTIATLNVSNPAQNGFGILVNQTSAGTLDLNVAAGSISTSVGAPISVTNSGGGTVDLNVTLATLSTSAPVATGMRFENLGAGTLTGSVNAAAGGITSTTDGLFVGGGALNVTYGGSITATAGNSVDVSGTSGDIALSGTINDVGAGVLVSNLLAGGSVSLSGNSNFTGSQGITATNIASGASVSFNSVTTTNTAGVAITLTNIDGSATFTGTTAINNPTTAGIVLGAGSTGTITFGDTDIGNLAANTTGLDARNAGGTVTFATLDIVGTSATGTRGIDLTGATFAGSVATTDSGTISGVGIGVDLTNAAITGTFQYGDGSNIDADGAASTINATTPIVITGLNGAQGTYNFADVDLIGNTSNLSTSATVFYVLQGASGIGTRDDPGSLSGAEAATADFIILLNDPAGGQDTLDATTGAAGSFDLDPGQTLLGFLNQDVFALPGGAPANVILFGITQGADNPFAGSGAPILTTTAGAAATVILSGNNLLDGLIVRNGGTGAGIFGTGLTGTITIRNSQVSGAASAINISDGAASASLLFQNLTLSATGGNILNLLGTGAGSLTIRALSGLTFDVGNGETGGLVINDAIFDSDSAAGGNQTVNAGAITIGTTADRVNGPGLSLTSVGGGLSFADLDIAANGGDGLLVANSAGLTLTTLAGTIDVTNGSGVHLTSPNLAMVLDSITVSGGAFGALFNTTSGSFVVTTLSATGVTNAGVNTVSAAGTINIGTLNISNPGQAGGGILINQTAAGTLDFDVGAGSISTSVGAPILVTNSGGGTVDLNVTLATLSTSAPVATGMRFENSGAGALTGSVNATAGTITSTTDGLFVSGGALNVTYGGSITANTGNSVDVSGTSGDIMVSGTITDSGAGVLVNNLLSGGSVSLTGTNGFTGSQGITATNIASGASVSFNSVTTTNTAGVAITLTNIDGSATFTGTTTITNPTTAGIVLGAGTSGTISFGDTDITGLAANTTGLDARNAGGTVTFATLDISGASATGTRGIDLTGATFAGSVTTTDSGTITGVGIGVDLTNAAITGTFQYGDGSNTDADGAASEINATTPLVITGMNGGQGTYDFEDVELIGDISNLTVAAFWVQEGATGIGSRNDPGSLSGAEASSAQYIILLNDPTGGQDTLDAAGAGGSFELDSSQNLLSFRDTDTFNVGGGAPANLLLFNIGGGVISNPFAGSGAPILTTTSAGAATLILGGTNIIDGVVIQNGASAANVGILGTNIVNVIIRNSSVQGRTGAISLADGAAASRLALSNLTLSSNGGDILIVDGSAGGVLSFTDFSNITLLGGNGEIGGTLISNVIFDADPTTAGIQTVNAGAYVAGTTSARVGGYGLAFDVVSGNLTFTSTDVAVARAINPIFGGSVALGIYADVQVAGSRFDFGTGNLNADALNGGFNEFHNGANIRVVNGASAGWSGNLTAVGANGAGGLRARTFPGSGGTLFLGGTDNDFSGTGTAAGTGGQALALIFLNVQNGSGGSAVIDTVTHSGGFGALLLSNLTMPAPLLFNGTVTSTGGGAGSNAISLLNAGTVQFNGLIDLNNVANGISLTATTTPSSVTFAGGLDIVTTGGFGLSAGASGAGSIALTITGTNNSITAAGTNGGLLLSNLTLSNGSGGAVNFANVNFTGTGGTAISITNNVVGTIDFANVGINTTGGSGINLTTSPSFNANFLNGLAITAANNGLIANGIGTLSVAGTANTINVTGSTALNITNSTIAAPGLTFQSISAGAAGTSITLNNTGALGGLTVTGTGTANSGGSVRNISLTNTRDVDLAYMNVNGTIIGFTVNNFSLDNSTVNGRVQFGDGTTNGLTGTGSFTNSSISNGVSYNLQIQNISGTLNLTVDNVDFGLTSSAVWPATSVLLYAQNAGTVMNIDFLNSDIHGSTYDVMRVENRGGATMDFVYDGNNMENVHPDKLVGQGLFIINDSSTMTFDVLNSTFNNILESSIRTASFGTGASISGTIDNNTIGTSGVPGSGAPFNSSVAIYVSAGAGTATYAVTNNEVYAFNGFVGIETIFDNSFAPGGASLTVNLTVRNNLLAEPGTTNMPGLTGGYLFETGGTVVTTLRIDGNNFADGDVQNLGDIYFRPGSTGQLRVFNYTGTTLADFQAFLLAQNNFAGTNVITGGDPTKIVNSPTAPTLP